MPVDDSLQPDPNTQPTNTQQTAILEGSPDLTPLDDSIKRIGTYTTNDHPEIERVIAALIGIATRDGLTTSPNTSIILRLNNQTTNTQLRVETQPPSNFSPEDREKHLFLSDYVLILVTLAKLLESIHHTEILEVFQPDFDELEPLREWGESTELDGQTYISEKQLEKNFYKVLGLLRDIKIAFDEIKEQHIDSPDAVDAGDADQKPSTAGLSLAAAGTIAELMANRPPNQMPDTDNSAITAAPVDTTNQAIREKIERQLRFVVAHAKDELIKDIFTQAGVAFDLSQMPQELQVRLQNVTDLLWRELWIIVDALPPEQLNQLLASTGDLTLRIELFKQLMNRVLSPGSALTRELIEIYKELTHYATRNLTAEETEALIAEIESKLATNATLPNESLSEIKQEIQIWKKQFLDSLTAQQTSAEPKMESQEEFVPFPERLLPPTVQTELTRAVDSAAHLDSTDKKILNKQSARLYWGTLAELFRDKDLVDLGTLPPEIATQVQSETISYLLTLSSKDIQSLQSSPSTLIRHIKNNSLRILSSRQFVESYSKYGSQHDTPSLSYTDRLEKETEWAYEQLEFQLFGAHNITDESTPDEPGLQDVFDELKVDLHENVYQFFEKLPSDDLEQLFIVYPNRFDLLKKIKSSVNNNPAFTQKLTTFYNNFLTRLGEDSPASRDRVLTSLSGSIKQQGLKYVLSDREISAGDALNNSLQNILQTDSQVLFQSVGTTLDGMLLGHGQEDISNFVQDARPELLSSMLGLPKGVVTTANIDQFRSLLKQYIGARAAQLTAVANLPKQGFIPSEGPTPDYKTAPAAAITSRFSAGSNLGSVISKVDNNPQEGADKVGSALGPTLKERAQIFHKLFEPSWNRLPTTSKIVVYLAMGLTLNDPRLLKTKTPDPTAYIPLPFEYILFLEKDPDGSMLRDLTSQYEREGKLLETTKVAIENEEVLNNVQRLRAEAELQKEIQKLIFDQASAEDQERIARAQNFESAEQYASMLAEEANQASLERAATLLSLNEELGYEATQGSPEERRSFLSFLGRGKKTASGGKKLADAVGTLAKGGAKKAAATKGAVGLVSKIKGLAGGIPGALATGAAWAAQNKHIRRGVAAGGLLLVGNTLASLSTIGGLLGALLGGAAGWFFGPLGALGGGILGANIGAQIIPWNWGNAVGFSPRLPPMPDPFASPDSYSSPSQTSMEAMRSSAGQSSLSGQGGGLGAAATTTPTTINSSTAAAQAAQAANTTATTSSAAATSTASAGAGGGASGILGVLPLTVTAPLIATASMMILTIFTITVIVGAFLVPTPIRDSNWRDQENFVSETDGLRFAELTKEVSVQQIENNTPTEATYTITVTPRGNYGIKVTGVEDTFFNFGEEGSGNMSQFSAASYPEEAFSETQTHTYSTTIGEGVVDNVINNNIILTFDVYDVNGFLIESGQTLSAGASVRVGEPTEGCWPTSGGITQLPFIGRSHGPRGFNSDAYDIGAPEGTRVYAPFSGRACRDDSLVDQWRGGYGRNVRLHTTIQGQSVEFIFAHLVDSPIGFGVCQQVGPGTIIGLVGNTGNSDGAHLHYELKRGTRFRLENLVPDRVRVGSRVNHCF